MAETNHAGEYEVVWPLGASTGEAVGMSATPETLEGATIGFMWDYVFRGDEIFAQLTEILGERYPGMRFVPYEYFGNIHSPQEREVVAAIPERCAAESVDAVVVGIGN